MPLPFEKLTMLNQPTQIEKFCTLTKEDGSPCHAFKIRGSKFCFLHDPNHAEERSLAQFRGGQALKRIRLKEPLPSVQVGSAKETVIFLNQLINEAREGKIDGKLANALGYLVSILLKGFEVSELEDKLTSIERLVIERKQFF